MGPTSDDKDLSFPQLLQINPDGTFARLQRPLHFHVPPRLPSSPRFEAFSMRRNRQTPLALFLMAASLSPWPELPA